MGPVLTPSPLQTNYRFPKQKNDGFKGLSLKKDGSKL